VADFVELDWRPVECLDPAAVAAGWAAF
jgi:hypothetical protein